MEPNPESPIQQISEPISPIKKNSRFFKILIIFVSVSVTWIISEIIFFNMVSFSENSQNKKCADFDQNAFSASYGYSLVNFHYPPLSKVFHCGLEWAYTYHIDKNGHRDPGEVLPNNNYLAVGDSFTFGFGVENNESFPARLQMHNAGLWGAPFDVQLNSLKRNVELLKPKVIVWSFYPSHIITMMPDAWNTSCPGDKVYFSDDSPFSNLARPLANITYVPIMNNSSFGKYMKTRLNIIKIEPSEEGIAVHKNCYETKEIILYDKNIVNNHYTDNAEVNKAFKPDVDKVYSQIEEYVAEAKIISETNKIEMYFVIIPSRLNLKLKQGEYNANYKNAEIDAELPLNKFKKIITESGFEENKIIDLSESFINSDGWEKYYYVKDAHWNKLGHEFVAKIIEQRINGNE